MNMKKTVMAIAAAMIMTLPAMAQDENNAARKIENNAAMVQTRTQAMAKRFGLNEEQTKQLQELNGKYADKMPMGRMQGMRQGGMMQRNQQKADSLRQSVRRVAGQNMRGNMRGNLENMRKVRAEYETELKKIMTSDQFQKYQESTQRRNRQPQGNRMRGNRNGNAE